MLQALVVILQIVLLLAGLAYVARHALAEQRAKPAGPPAGTVEKPTEPLRAGFVRLSDYEADQSALKRRLTDIETGADARHQQLTGLIGQMRRADKGAQKEEIAAALSQSFAERRTSEDESSNGQRRVRVIRRA